MDNIEPGQVVISKAGRDKGRKFIILKEIDKDYVYIVDGCLRKVEKPKKKKIKHLKIVNITSNTLRNKIETIGNVENFEIRNFLKSLEEKN
ncbi:MAG: RNA-binding protein [Firmicutes bacterium]|nr:RNA-binding protein [Bacillota bacterium]